MGGRTLILIVVSFFYQQFLNGNCKVLRFFSTAALTLSPLPSLPCLPCRSTSFTGRTWKLLLLKWHRKTDENSSIHTNLHYSWLSLLQPITISLFPLHELSAKAHFFHCYWRETNPKVSATDWREQWDADIHTWPFLWQLNSSASQIKSLSPTLHHIPNRLL